MQNAKNNRWSWLKSPWTILIALVLGTISGIFFKKFSLALEPFGKMFMFFLQMSVIPILITAIVYSLGKLIKSNHAKESLKKMVAVIIISLTLVSLFGLIVSSVTQPGNLDQHTRAKLGQIINSSGYAPDLEISLSEAPQAKNEAGFSDFLIKMIPPNIFSALSTGRALELVFFSIIFGIALGFTKGEGSHTVLSLSQTLFETFQKIIDWAMYGLPFGLFFLLAAQIASVGTEILLMMLKFIIIFYITGFLLLIVNSILIWKKSGKGLGVTLKALMEPIIVALATRSSFACIPAAIDSLEKKLDFDEISTNLFIPLGTTICRYGNILFFAIATLFVTQLYGVDLGFSGYLIALFGCVLAGLATTGATSILTLPMLAIVFEPLGLPLEAVLIIFIAIDPIIDPMRTLLIVHTNLASTAFIAEKKAAVKV